MRLMGNPRPAWFLGHLSQIKRAVDLGIGKRFGLIGKWERDAFIGRLQSVLQKNGQFGIPCLPSGEHIPATRWCPQCGNISGEFPIRALHFPLFWERSKQSAKVYLYCTYSWVNLFVPKKLSRLFLGHFWTKIWSGNCFEIHVLREIHMKIACEPVNSWETKQK